MTIGILFISIWWLCCYYELYCKYFKINWINVTTKYLSIDCCCYSIHWNLFTIVDRTGRKVKLSWNFLCIFIYHWIIFIINDVFVSTSFLYIVSTIGAALTLIILGIYMMLKSWHYNIQSFNLIPLVDFSFIIFFTSFVILTLVFTVIAELMPENLKKICVSSGTAVTSIFQPSIISKYFPFMLQFLGFHTSMFMFAAVCLINTVILIIILYVPETKGKSYE